MGDYGKRMKKIFPFFYVEILCENDFGVNALSFVFS